MQIIASALPEILTLPVSVNLMIKLYMLSFSTDVQLVALLFILSYATASGDNEIYLTRNARHEF